MFTRFPLYAGLFCVAAGAANAQSFSCPGFDNVDIRITLIEGTDAAIAEFISTDTATEAADPVTMRAEPGGDGLAYSAGDLVLGGTSDAPELTAGGTTLPCAVAGVEQPAVPAEQPAEIIEEPEVAEAPVQEVAPEDPQAPIVQEAPAPEVLGAIAAISLGGNLRSGPGTDFEDIGGLDEGTAITLQADTGVAFNGYNWWEIVLPNGSVAFQWGGVICVPGGGVANVIEDPTLCAPEATPDAAEAVNETAEETLTPTDDPAAPLPVDATAALSLGGNLRSGPGTAFPDIGDAAPGTELTLLSDSGIPFDGYNWWQVELPNGEVAFQWGGVICVPSGGVPGLLASCP
jgi:hypothetical protein